jgi:hypothetical protein
VIFAIDDASANDVMVVKMVRRSGFRIVSSVAAVAFDCLLEVVWLADQRRETRIRHNGPQPQFACRQPMPTDPTLARTEVGIFPF